MTPPTPTVTTAAERDFQPLREMSETFNQAVVSDFFDHLLAFALRSGVTDLHLLEGRPPVARSARTCFQLRWPDELQDLMRRPDSWNLLTNALSEALHQSPDRALPHRCAFNFQGVRVRLVSYRSYGRHALALRFQPAAAPDLATLGLPAPLVRQLRDPSPGLVLISGGPCAGKTTTMAAVVDHYNQQPDFHVRTLESPVEFVHEPKRALITQQQVGPGPDDDVADYNTAVEEALMQDINVIAVGEIKDLPTLRAALKAANNNLLVLATIHATDVPQTLVRVLQDFPEPDRPAAAVGLARCLKIILCQRLQRQDDAPGAVPSRIHLRAQAGVFHRVASLRQRVLEGRFEGLGDILAESRSQAQGCVDQFRDDPFSPYQAAT